MRLLQLSFIALLIASCQETKKENEPTIEILEFQNKGHELVYDFVQKVGNFEKLNELKDVVYNYTYTTADQKKDSTTEQYIFEGELSYAKYHKHERTLPELPGNITQSYDGENFWLKQNDELIAIEPYRKKVTFNRKTNYYWFTMMQKLLDPSVIFDYVGADSIQGKQYSVVKISFETSNDKPTDTYQLYINQETGMVDQFLFTVVDFNVTEPLLMVLEYETVEGLMIPTKRKYTKANWDGEPLNEDWIQVRWSNIKFNNGLTAAMFKP